MCNAHFKLETQVGRHKTNWMGVSVGKEDWGKILRTSTCCSILTYRDTVHLNSKAVSPSSNRARGGGLPLRLGTLSTLPHY